MITPNYLDLVLWSFNRVIEAGWAILTPAVLWLFWSMALIYLLWSGIRTSRQAKNPIEVLFGSFFAFLKVFIYHWALDESSTPDGNAAGGADQHGSRGRGRGGHAHDA